MATFEHDEHTRKLVDTPGYPDFAGEMLEGFQAADGALFMMDASAASRPAPS